MCARAQPDAACGVGGVVHVMHGIYPVLFIAGTRPEAYAPPVRYRETRRLHVMITARPIAMASRKLVKLGIDRVVTIDVPKEGNLLAQGSDEMGETENTRNANNGGKDAPSFKKS